MLDHDLDSSTTFPLEFCLVDRPSSYLGALLSNTNIAVEHKAWTLQEPTLTPLHENFEDTFVPTDHDLVTNRGLRTDASKAAISILPRVTRTQTHTFGLVGFDILTLFLAIQLGRLEGRE